MSDASNRIVQKLWSYCHVLRDDGLSYQDYLEQLTFLLFLKMADERARLTGEEQPIPAGYRWVDLAAPQMEGVELEQHYRETLRKFGQQCDVHTLLRLPTGIFYAQGVKANVLFFDRKPGAPHPWTKTVWVYDLRTNKHFTLKTRRMTRADLDDFVACYRPGDRHNRKPTRSEDTPEGRWRPYGYDEILSRDKVSLDLFWLRDESLEDSARLPDPNVLAQEIADDLRSALAQIEDVLGDLERRVGSPSP